MERYSKQAKIQPLPCLNQTMADSEPKPDRYAVIGHPVAHSRSPMIHEVFARQTSENMTYELLDVEPKDFEVAVRGFGAAGGKGLNVTVPHKPAAFELATELSDAAKRAGAVNTLSFLPGGAMRGDNTDGVGFMHDLTRNHGQDVAGKTILILGAGGATRGILDPILEAAPAAVLIANRTPERAADLVLEYQTDVPLSACRFDDLRTRDLSDIVINATSAGVRGESPPFPPDASAQKASVTTSLTASRAHRSSPGRGAWRRQGRTGLGHARRAGRGVVSDLARHASGYTSAPRGYRRLTQRIVTNSSALVG